MEWQDALTLATEHLASWAKGWRVADKPWQIRENDVVFEFFLMPFVPGAPRVLYVFKETAEVRARRNRGSSAEPNEEPTPGGATRPVAPWPDGEPPLIVPLR